MLLTRVLLAKSSADFIREQILRGVAPRMRRPTILHEKEAEYFEKLFRYFDANGDRYLNKGELMKLVRFQSNDELNNIDINKPFEQMDLNSDNKISLQEYLHHVSKRKKKLPMNEDLQEIFNLYDRNSDAHINLNELRQILLYMGEDFTRSDLRNLFVGVDNDKDGLIDLFQFLDLIKTKIRSNF